MQTVDGNLPWSQAGDDHTRAVTQCLRDIVALSTLPAMWSGADPTRIAESLADSLFATLDAEFVCIYFTGDSSGAPLALAQTNRYKVSATLAAQVETKICDWATRHDPEELLILPNPLRDGNVHITTRPLGHHAELGVLAAAFVNAGCPTPTHHLLLNVAAAQATIAVQNAQLLRALRHSEERLRGSNAELARHLEDLTAANAEIELSRHTALDLMGQALAAKDALRESEGRLRKRAAQLQELAKAARLITSSLSLRALLESLTNAAREIIPAHQCVTSLTVNDDWGQAVQALSLSEKYADWRHYDAKPDGSGIYSIVCRENRPLRMTQSELEAHPAWKGFGKEAKLHPHMRGWLAVPLIDADGTNMGLLQMSDKYEGDFTEDDEALLVQLAQIASVAITNARLYETVRISEEQLRLFSQELESKVEERTKELVQSQQRLRELATELNLAEQRERKRLAAELHDYLAQILVLLKFKLDQAKRAGERDTVSGELLRQAQELLAEALSYTRTLVHDLSPSVLHEFGLPAALKWLGNRMLRHELAVTMELSGEEELKLPEDQAVLLFQSVRELLVNAAKHAKSSHARVEMGIVRDELRIAVHDDGAGFDVAKAGLDRSATDLSTGVSSKFGLFSIRERMKAMGGSFELQSTLGQGTTAALVLPLRRADDGMSPTTSTPKIDQRHPGRPPASAHAGKGVRVLLVDDHAMMRQGLRSVLEAYADLQVVGEASDGEVALNMVEEHVPSVVVMDINMPKMNGIQATRLIKTRHPDIEVIGLSVNAHGDNETAMKNAGAMLLLTKEAAVEHLYEAIQRVVNKKEVTQSGRQ